MEMEYKDPSRRGRYIVVLGVVLAVLSGAAAFFLINQAQGAANTATLPKVSIVVATRDIPARKAIAPDDVTVREVPVDDTNAQAVYADPAKVVGLVPGVTILAGQPIYSNFLASQSQGGQFSIIGPGETISPTSEAWRAVSLTVPDDRAVGGLLRPGDAVDIFVTATVQVPASVVETGPYYPDKATKITYQNVTVLAKAGTFYVIKVSEAIGEEISHLQATGAGAFSLALRPPSDTRVVDASRMGETTNLIIQRYGLPIPEAYPAGKGIPTGPAPTPFPTPVPGPSGSPTAPTGPTSSQPPGS
ncbi:MAG: Flp pilus assembly protein CpaB [Candidatus Limnocylindrales bacterium]